MMWTRLLLGCVILVPAIALAQLPPPLPATDPPAPPPGEDVSGNPLWPVLVLPTEQGLNRRLEAARDYIRVADYPQAVRQIQYVLDTPEDLLIRPKTPRESWQSVRRQAEQLLETLPAAGKEVYAVAYEPTARELLAKARRQNDPRLLADLARRYRYTESGETALTLLAGYYLDRGLFHPAARAYEDLLQRTPVERLPIAVLVQAVAAFRAGQRGPGADRAWQALAARSTGGKIKLGRRDFTLADLDKSLGKMMITTAGIRPDSRLYRGDESHNGSYSARPPLLEALARVETTSSVLGKELLTRAARANPKALPGAHPVATGNRVLVRTSVGVAGIDILSGQKVWEAPLELSLDGLLRHPGRKQQLLHWLGMYREGLQSLLFENTVNGTLSTDGQNVYAVEDVAQTISPFKYWQQANEGFQLHFGPMKEWMNLNRLRAFDVVTGKATWQLGGPRGVSDPEFAEVLFLGPPLPLEGHLWVLIEKQRQLILHALDPATGTSRFSQKIGGVNDRIQMNLVRRCSAVHLAAADGLLLVPTHHGGIVAVDPLARQLVWAHTYADRPAINPDAISPDLPQMRELWESGYRGGAPLIAEGRVVLTGPDTQAIRCLRLEDGRLLWTSEIQANEDLYVAAIHKGTVVLVGRHFCRALSLSDGKPLWQQPILTPTGQGVRCEGTYWLPVAEGGLLAVDLEGGKQPVRLGSEVSPVLGNLIVHQGAFWSQDAFQVTAYPDVSRRLLTLDELLVVNPENISARLERAQMRLSQRKPREAEQDLRRVLATPALDEPLRQRAREYLFQALTQILSNDPTGARPFLAEYLALCDVPIADTATAEVRARLEREKARRQLQAVILISRSHAVGGRHREAAESLTRNLRTTTAELLPDAEDPVVEAAGDVQLERTLRELLRQAPPAGQSAIRAVLARTLTEPTGAGGSEGLLRLARLADLYPAPERLALLRRLLDLPVPPGRVLLLQEAVESRLSRPEDVGPVLLLRAESLMRAGLLEDAAECYRRLGRECSQVVVTPGQTGAQVLESARQDRRLLVAFDSPPGWTATRYGAREERVAIAEPARPLQRLTDDHSFRFPNDLVLRNLPMRLLQAPSAAARSLRIALETRKAELVVQDSAGNTLWTLPTKSTPSENLLHLDPRGCYVIIGSVALARADSYLYGIDLPARRLLWSQRLLPGDRDPRLENSSLTVSVQGYLEAFTLEGDQCRLRVGLGGPLTPERVFLQMPGMLVALDPFTGRRLWQRSKVPPVRIGGDAQHLLLLETPTNDPICKRAQILRAADGRAVRMAPGWPEVQQPQKVMQFLGTDPVLLERTPEDRRFRLRRYDPLTGRDRWSLEVPAETQWLDSLDPETLGFAGKPGEVRLLDLNTGKDRGLSLALGKDVLQETQLHHVLADADRWYVLVHEQDASLMGDGNPFIAGAVPVLGLGGKLLAFDRKTGKLLWRTDLTGLNLLLEPLEQTPFLVALAQVNSQINPRTGTAVRIRIMDRVTGKMIHAHEEEQMNVTSQPARVPYLTPFHTPRWDPLGNWFELSGTAVRVRVEER